VNAALVEEGVKIPFPQRDLHVRSTDSGTSELVVASPQDTAKRP